MQLLQSCLRSVVIDPGVATKGLAGWRLRPAPVSRVKNKVPLIFAGLKEAPVLAASSCSIGRKNLKDVTTGEPQKKAAHRINNNFLDPWR